MISGNPNFPQKKKAISIFHKSNFTLLIRLTNILRITNISRQSIFLLAILTFAFLVNDSSISQVSSEAILENVSVTAIRDEPSYLWLATYGQGIYKYSKKDDKWTNFSSGNNSIDNDLFSCIAVNDDYVWAGSIEGLFTYDKKRNTWRKRKFAVGGEMGNWIRSLCYDKKENTLWIGRFKNLTELDVKKQKFTEHDLTKNNDPKTNTIKSIKMDGDSLIWFGSESGVHVYNKHVKDSSSAWTFINNKKGFNTEGDAVSVSDFLFDGENVWFATDEFVTPQQPNFNLGGIYKFNRKLDWERISKQDGLPGNGIYSLEKTGNKIWAAVYAFDKKNKKEYGKGFVIIDRITGKVLSIDLNQTNISSSLVQTLYFDGSAMWVGTDKGLYNYSITNPLAEWKEKKEVPKKNKKK
jgi:ligand-binding sensor domain-containing protein